MVERCIEYTYAVVSITNLKGFVDGNFECQFYKSNV